MKNTHVGKRPRLGNTILKEKKFGGLTLPDFPSMVWGKNGQTGQRNRKKSPDRCKYSQLVFGKDSKQFSVERMIFSANDTRPVGHSYVKKN